MAKTNDIFKVIVHEKKTADCRYLIKKDIRNWNRTDKFPNYSVRAIFERMAEEGILSISYKLSSTPENEYSKKVRKFYTKI